MSSKRLTVVKPTPEPSYKAFDEFARNATYIASEYERLREAQKTAEFHLSFNVKYAIRTAEKALKAMGFHSGFPAKTLKECREFLQTYVDDDVDEAALYRAEIAKRVALLLGSFPNTSSIPDPKIYTRMLIEELIASNEPIITIESTCRKIRRTATFPPSVGEVLKALEQEAKLWGPRYAAIADLNEVHTNLKNLHADLVELERREPGLDGVPLRRFADDERVVHWRFGCGAVAYTDRNPALLCVCLDNNRYLRLLAAAVEPEDLSAHIERGAAREKNSRFPTGTRVRHQRFGVGTVTEADGVKLTVQFDTSGCKLILDAFVEPEVAPPQIEHRPVIDPLAGLNTATTMVEAGHGE